MGLIAVFGVSVTAGLMAEHHRPLTHAVRSTKPNVVPPSGDERKIENETGGEIDREADSSRPKTKISRPAVVAVIDTGIDFEHPDLIGHAWVNPGETGPDQDGHEKSKNGKDDDGNGLIDDVNGYDFAGATGTSRDTHGHGTHIAGIVRREAPHAKIMNLKYFNRGMDGISALKSSLRAIRYAIDKKVDIINYSGGGTVPSIEELAVLTEASRQGILIVAAAGNESSNSERAPFYPANYRLPNILSVTAIEETGREDRMLPTSNFGVTSVAVAALGKDVWSTLPRGRHGAMTGTSQATAFVTAAAIQILEASWQEGDYPSAEEVIERVVASSKESRTLKGKTKIGSKLATSRALKFKGGHPTGERRLLIEAFEKELGEAGLGTQAATKVKPFGR